MDSSQHSAWNLVSTRKMLATVFTKTFFLLLLLKLEYTTPLAPAISGISGSSTDSHSHSQWFLRIEKVLLLLLLRLPLLLLLLLVLLFLLLLQLS